MFCQKSEEIALIKHHSFIISNVFDNFTRLGKIGRTLFLNRVKFSSTIFEISVTVTNASGIRSVGRLYSHMGAHFEAL